MARDLGVALFMLIVQGKGSSTQVREQAAKLLEGATTAFPEDLDALEAKGHVFTMQGKFAPGLAAFEAVLAAQPDREISLLGAALASEGLNRFEDALRHLRQAIRVNPWFAQHRSQLAILLARLGRWEAAYAECQAWIRLNPLDVRARQLRISCLLKEGKKELAREEFARIEALQPENLGQLRGWFAAQLR